MDNVKELAFADYQSGMKLKDIAEKYDISGATVRSWKKRSWSGDAKAQRKATRNAQRNVAAQHEAATQRNVAKKMLASVDANDELTEAQKEFCIFYSQSKNAARAYLKSHPGCTYNTALSNGYRMLQKAHIKAELVRLRDIKSEALGFLTAKDVVEQYVRIAFADMRDFAEWKKGVGFVDSDTVDGTLVTEVSETKDGVKIKLADKLKALEFLANYLGLTKDAAAGDNGEAGTNFLAALQKLMPSAPIPEPATEPDGGEPECGGDDDKN